jgi:light-regulated signal transduction histidine kinase (bacteriophytochrome)
MELKTDNKDLKTISYCLSHDLKTALVVIGGFSGRLLEKYASHLDEKGQGKRWLPSRVFHSFSEHINLRFEDQ